MKITIDTSAKTIKVEEQVNFSQLQDEITKLLGESAKEYTLIQSDLNIVYIPMYQQPYTYWSVQPYFNPTVLTVPCNGYATTNLMSYTATSN